jgi:hypothetical protein
MRSVTISKLLLLAGSVLGLLTVVPTPNVQAAGGVTIAPATLTLRLASGASTQTTNFTVTNNYLGPVRLHFAFEPRANTISHLDPKSYLSISQPDVTLAAGASLKQTVVLRDIRALGPGSRQPELVVTQTSSGGAATIGVLPSIRMPIIVIKEDGAVSAISLGKLYAPYIGFSLPKNITTTIHNNGNMIAIPRGFITVTGPNGTLMRKGILNEASKALSPGADLALTTPLHNLGSARWPGIYKISLSYGLGGGQKTLVSSHSMFYVAWWHVLLAAALAVIIRYLWQHTKLWQHDRKLKAKRQASRRILLIGRDIT